MGKSPASLLKAASTGCTTIGFDGRKIDTRR
jgi:hypothetical protein